jgi:hypothetical protein
VIGGGDFLEVGVGQFAVDAVNEGAELAGVDEKGLFAAVAKTPLTPALTAINIAAECMGWLGVRP